MLRIAAGVSARCGPRARRRGHCRRGGCVRRRQPLGAGAAGRAGAACGRSPDHGRRHRQLGRARLGERRDLRGRGDKAGRDDGRRSSRRAHTGSSSSRATPTQRRTTATERRRSGGVADARSARSPSSSSHLALTRRRDNVPRARSGRRGRAEDGGADPARPDARRATPPTSRAPATTRSGWRARRRTTSIVLDVMLPGRRRLRGLPRAARERRLGADSHAHRTRQRRGSGRRASTAAPTTT